jgi:Flp pilus assembly protein TadB
VSRRLRWEGRPDLPPKNPYRDTFAVYGVLALIVVLVAWLTGGSVGRAIVVAIFFYVVACAWTIYRMRARERKAAEAEQREGGT